MKIDESKLDKMSIADLKALRDICQNNVSYYIYHDKGKLDESLYNNSELLLYNIIKRFNHIINTLIIEEDVDKR